MATPALVDDMGVDNVGFLIENLGADASELQYLRELVQNAFESIQRAGRGSEGRIEIDYDLVDGVKKLRITDNGVGMTPEEVSQNINRLSASGGIQSFQKNFGIGAKITAGVRNPHGVVYKAWKDGDGSVTILGRKAGRYGRIGIEDPETGDVDYWLPLPDEDKPDMIDDAGISVILLGQSSEDDTSQAPEGAELPSQWVAAYLERRYFDVPKGTTVKVRRPNAIYDSERGEERFINDTIRGQRYYLDQHSESSGIVTLPVVSSRVWWWLLSEDITKGGKTWNNRGHVAALYQDELYEVRTGNSGRSALKDFGMYAGHQRIVIYAEPNNVLKANTPRTSLILEGNIPVDYAEIGAAFAEEMPLELASYMAGQVTSEQSDHKKAIRKNLQEVEEELKAARYRRSQTGKVDRFEPESGVESGSENDTYESGATRRTRSDDAAGRLGSEYLRKAREERGKRLRGERADNDQMPTIRWTADNSTVPSGRAATYVKTGHIVTATTAFGFYQDVVEWSMKDARSRAASDIDDETLREMCEDEVKRWFEQALVEAVVSLQPMSHDRHWGPMVYATGLSDEGLTAAVMSHRWHMMSAIKRGLAGRLGRSKGA